MMKGTVAFWTKLLSRFRLSSIKSKFIAVFMLSSITPIIMLGAWSYSSAVASVREQYENSSFILLNRGGASLDMMFQQISDLTASVSRNALLLNAIENHHLKNLSQSLIENEIDYYVKRLNIPVKVLIILKDGQHFGNYSHTAIEMQDGIANIMNSEWYTGIDPFDTQVRFAGLRESFFSGYETRYHLYFYKNIIDYQSDQVGIVMVDVGAYLIDRLLRSLTEGSGDSAYLLGEDFSVLSLSTEDRSKESMDFKQYSSLLSESLGNFGMEFQGEKFITSFTTLHHNGWKLVRITPSQNITRNVKAIPILTIILVLILLIIEAGLYVMVNTTITTPILHLSSEMKKVEGGVFDTAIISDADGEIGILIQGFNSMTAEIKKLIQRIIEDENEANELEFAMLQAQINPHFLYNTLNSISKMAEIADACNVGDAIKSLISLLKYAISDRHDCVPLHTEVEYIKNYVDLSNIRFNNKIILENRIAENVINHHILKFTLQPLVENAILHGLKFRKGVGKIVLEAFCDQEGFFITVTDNGIGISSEMIEKLLCEEKTDDKDKMTHIGINSVNRRVKLHYGEKYGLSIKSCPGHWTQVTVRLPAEMGAQNETNDS